MAQAERVADLVHRHVLQEIGDQLVGLRTVGVEFAARLEQRQRKADLARRVLAVVAQAAIDRADRLDAQIAGRLVVHRLIGDDAFGSQRADVARHVRVPADVGVENLAAARIDMRRPDGPERRRGRRQPSHRRVLRLAEIEVRVIRLLQDDDRVLEANLLERLVPLEDALTDRLAVLFRNLVREPERDRLDRLGQRGVRVLLLEPPALHVEAHRRELRVIAEVDLRRVEVTDARVSQTRAPSAALGSLRERVQEAEEQAARILDHRRRRIERRRRHAGNGRRRRRHRDARLRVVRRHVEHRPLRAALGRLDKRIARVER